MTDELTQFIDAAVSEMVDWWRRNYFTTGGVLEALGYKSPGARHEIFSWEDIIKIARSKYIEINLLSIR